MRPTHINSEKINYFKTLLPNINESFKFKVFDLNFMISKVEGSYNYAPLEFIRDHLENLSESNISEVPIVRDHRFYCDKNKGYQVYEFTQDIKEQCEALGKIFENKPGYKHTCVVPTKDLKATCKWVNSNRIDSTVEISEENQNYRFSPYERILALYDNENQKIPRSLIVPCDNGKCEIPVPDSIVIKTCSKEELSKSTYKIDKKILWKVIYENQYSSNGDLKAYERLDGRIERAFYFRNCFWESSGKCTISKDDYILSVVTIEKGV